MAERLRAVDLDLIFLVSPTTAEARLRRVGETASGFVYYVALKGVTGAASLDAGAVAGELTRIRQYVQLPLGVGFGIRDATSARQVAGTADAVVVGSALVERLQAAGADAPAAAKAFITELRAAIDGARAA